MLSLGRIHCRGGAPHPDTKLNQVHRLHTGWRPPLVRNKQDQTCSENMVALQTVPNPSTCIALFCLNSEHVDTSYITENNKPQIRCVVCFNHQYHSQYLNRNVDLLCVRRNTNPKLYISIKIHLQIFQKITICLTKFKFQGH